MIKIVEFFKKLNWFERIFPIVGLIAVSLSFALSPDRFWLSFVYSLVGIIETFLVAKGFFIAPFVTLVVSILYLFLSISQSFYGEVIIAGYYIIISIFSIIAWLKSRSKQDDFYVQVNKLKGKEYLLIGFATVASSFGFYFMLKAFNTNELIVSTISMVASLIASYLMLRRSRFYAAAYIVNDITIIILWSFTIKSMGLAFLPSILAYAFYLINDIYAYINWKLMEKRQTEHIEQETTKIEINSEKDNAM